VVSGDQLVFYYGAMSKSKVELPKIAILGGGSMGRAILAGLLRKKVHVVGGITVTNRSPQVARPSDDAPQLTALATETDPEANRVAVAGAGIVLVAVKPTMVPGLLAEIADALDPGALVISVAAGVPVSRFEELLPETVGVVRSMPNTPALVRRAVTGLSAGTRSTPDQMALARTLFETVGTVIEVPESQLDALSTISGSGPAYVFFLIEQLTATAISKGFTPQQAAEMVNGTFVGAARLLEASGRGPTQLRVQVTSPKGTTEQAVAVLQESDIKEVFDRATDAALARAHELARG
jgi:pyrroline-5-carboxylate reductase